MTIVLTHKSKVSDKLVVVWAGGGIAFEQLRCILFHFL